MSTPLEGEYVFTSRAPSSLELEKMSEPAVDPAAAPSADGALRREPAPSAEPF